MSLIALVFWELNHKDPVIDLQAAQEPQFRAHAAASWAITGMILFGTTQLIPQMLQQVLGYTLVRRRAGADAGGVATLVAVPFAGRLTGKVDARFLLVRRCWSRRPRCGT